MRSFRILPLIFSMFIMLPVLGYSQTGDDDSMNRNVEEEEDGFSVSIDLRISANAIGIIPGLSSSIGVPISFGASSVSLVPQAGFQYYFDVWTDVHGNYYIPVGLSVIYNPMNLGVEVLYYPSVGEAEGVHHISASVFSETDIVALGSFSMHFGLNLGPIWVLDATESSVLLRVNSVLIFRYGL